MAHRAPRHEGEEWDPSDQSSKQASRATATVPLRRYLRLEGLRSGAPDLILGCVTDSGSLAGKVSTSSRSSWFCRSLPEVSCFGFLSALAVAFAVMVRSYASAARQGTNAIGSRSLRRCRIVVFGFPGTGHSARMLPLRSAVPFKAKTACGALSLHANLLLNHHGNRRAVESTLAAARRSAI
jgi:hypothetical protein